MRKRVGPVVSWEQTREAPPRLPSSTASCRRLRRLMRREPAARGRRRAPARLRAWRAPCLARGRGGLVDAPRPGRPPRSTRLPEGSSRRPSAGAPPLMGCSARSGRSGPSAPPGRGGWVPRPPCIGPSWPGAPVTAGRAMPCGTGRPRRLWPPPARGRTGAKNVPPRSWRGATGRGGRL
jgi:hypothetical protein